MVVSPVAAFLLATVIFCRAQAARIESFPGSDGRTKASIPHILHQQPAVSSAAAAAAAKPAAEPAAVTSGTTSQHETTAYRHTKKPNIVFILVDDQDKAFNSSHPRFQPALHNYLRQQGVEFDQHYVTTPVCCPSRTNILFGKYSHNTNMTDVFPPHGGYTKWLTAGLNKGPYLPQYLQAAGYQTYYTGKFLVEYALYNKNPVPEGWDDFDAAIHPWVFRYDYPVFSRNGGDATLYAGQYHTDVVASKAVAQIQTALKSDKPFFIQVAPIGCHDHCYVDDDFNGYITPPIPAPRHAKLYADVDLTHLPNFNEEDVADKPLWLRSLSKLDQANVSYLNEYHRARLRSLRAVDELIERLVKEVKAAGELENTYFIYTGDNGYHLGSHRMGGGKETPYQEDLQVPLVITGPGIKKGVLSNQPTAHEDLVPTILSLAGVHPLPSDLDGQPLPLPLQDHHELELTYQQPKSKFEQHLTEYWGFYSDQLFEGFSKWTNFTWKAVSVHSADNREYKYVVWCTGERELYDRTADRFELVNIIHSADTRLTDRLDALLSALSQAKGIQLLNPWSIIHPSDDSVNSLATALESKHDAYYKKLPKFKFLDCIDHYEKDNEISAFYHTDEQRARLLAAAAAAGPVNAAALSKQRLMHYREAITSGYARQQKLATEQADASSKNSLSSSSRLSTAGPLNYAGASSERVAAEVEVHATPLPAAVLERFSMLHARLVDEKKYQRLRSMA